MIPNLPSLLEVKFACPHCDQHIACDSAYCGTRIECPACHREMQVPKPSAFDPSPSVGLSLAATGSSAPPDEADDQPPTVGPWTEEEWTARNAGANLRDAFAGRGSIALQSWFWLFFLAPLLMFFWGGGLEFRWLSFATFRFLFIMGAIMAGFLVAKSVSTSLVGLIPASILFSILILLADAVVCFFGGCAMACTQSAAMR
jgi:hypothetical protein